MGLTTQETTHEIDLPTQEKILALPRAEPEYTQRLIAVRISNTQAGVMRPESQPESRPDSRNVPE